MKRNIKSLTGYTMGAIDGKIGKVKEFYFDDVTWAFRYIIVETGSWLNNRKVLIPPEALLTPDWKKEVLPVNLTKEQIKNSPDIDTEQTVSRQREIEMYEYYSWTNYWSDSMGTPGMMTPVYEPIEEETGKENNPGTKDADGDPHLRSTHKVRGYNIDGIDGKIGEVEDFILDDHSWKLDFLVADTGHWFPGKKTLLSTKLINEINWNTATVVVNATVEDVKNSPEYPPGRQITELYEAKLQNYYGRLAG